jgi:hypothetical protein
MDKFLNINKKREVKESESKEKRKREQKKYVDSYLDFGFTYAYKDDKERPQCVVCFKALAAKRMLPNKLKSHLITAHSNLLSKPREYFSRKLTELNEQTANFSKRASIPAKVLLASYKVAYHVAKCKKKTCYCRRTYFTISCRYGFDYGWGVCCKTTFECAFVQQHYYPSNL